MIHAMRGLVVVASAFGGLILGRLSAPSVDAAPPAAVERPVAAATRVVPPPVCPPINAQVEIDATAAAAAAARAEQEAQALDASQMAAAQEALARERDPQRRSELIREIAAHKARDDLGIAWTWLAQHRHDPGYAENVRNLLYQWSYARPEHVAALLPQVTSAEAQTAAAQQLAQLWNRKDPPAYQAWVASLPEGPLKAAARSPY